MYSVMNKELYVFEDYSILGRLNKNVTTQDITD